MRFGLYPGSFDPVTYGHLDVVRRSLTVVDRLIIGLAMDTVKDCLFSVEDRLWMLSETVQETMPSLAHRIEILAFQGLLVHFCRQRSVSLIIRGIRAVSDYEFEFQLAGVNAALAPDIETIFLPAADGTQHIASRYVKEVARLGGPVHHFTPSSVERRLRAMYPLESES